jgi:hypothetical protein
MAYPASLRDYIDTMVNLRREGAVAVNTGRQLTAFLPYMSVKEADTLLAKRGSVGQRAYLFAPSIRYANVLRVLCAVSTATGFSIYAAYCCLVKETETVPGATYIGRLPAEVDEWAAATWGNYRYNSPVERLVEHQLYTPGNDKPNVLWSAIATELTYGDPTTMYKPVHDQFDDVVIDITATGIISEEMQLLQPACYLCQYCGLCGGALSSVGCRVCGVFLTGESLIPALPYTVANEFVTLGFNFLCDVTASRRMATRSWAYSVTEDYSEVRELLPYAKQQRGIVV